MVTVLAQVDQAAPVLSKLFQSHLLFHFLRRLRDLRGYLPLNLLFAWRRLTRA